MIDGSRVLSTLFPALLASLAAGLLPNPALAASECDTPVLSSQLACKLEMVSWVDVELSGSAEKLGIKRQELERIIRLRLRNDLASLSHEALPFDAALKQAGNTGRSAANPFLDSRGALRCLVWTVGDDFPVAYLVECALEGYGHYEQDSRQFSSRALGYSPKERLRSALDETLRNTVTAIAGEFLEARIKARTDKVAGGSQEAEKVVAAPR